MSTSKTTKAPRPVERGATGLLWGWPELLAAIPLSRRALTRMVSDGRFPKPIRRVGRRPLWKPATIRAWVEGGAE